MTTRPLRIGNFSAYYGDRTDTFDELLRSGVDVLAGDYLAELTMLVLRKTQLRGGDGFATGFVRQMDRYLPDIADAGVRLVTNAGGLDPLGCAAEVERLVAEKGLGLTVAAITGDDLRERGAHLTATGETWSHIDTGMPLPQPWSEVVTANVYLGAWPIVEALARGADIVICPRVTDASLIMGPAAWHHGWGPKDLDPLAGALWAGHAIECGGQVTGGNFSFFHEHPDLGIPGMPIAEVHADGSCVVTKADQTGGVVTVDTVTAQLLYEVGSPRYLNPDVVADLSGVVVQQESADRVRISGARGWAPPSTLKVSVSLEGGYRNSVTIGLTGRHQTEKLAWLRRQVDQVLGDVAEFDSLRWTVVGPRDETSGDLADATAFAVITARAAAADRVGRGRFADAIVQLGVSSIPGCYFAAPPQREKLAGVQWPCLIDRRLVQPQVKIKGETITVPWTSVAGSAPAQRPEAPAVTTGEADGLTALPLGDLFGTRSGDKAGTANVGVWARGDQAWSWLRAHLDVDLFRELVPEAADLPITRYEMPGLRGLNFVVEGFLEHGVATSTRVDNQAKGLGEYLGSRLIQVPTDLVDSSSTVPLALPEEN